MTGDRARSALVGTRFADVRWVADTGSTNTDVLDLARDGAPEGVVLVADHQRAGRGRLDRSWQAPAGASLLVSILLRPDLAVEHLFAPTMAVGLSAVEACREISGVAPSLKWPNDLVVGAGRGPGRKLGGMLTESVVEGGRTRALVVGLGLNVNWPAALPEELADIATSLNHEAGSAVDREGLLVALLQRLDRWCSALTTEAGRAALRADYLAHCATIGRRVRAELPQERMEGTAVALTAEGHLVIESDDGARRVIAAGDLVHLR